MVVVGVEGMEVRIEDGGFIKSWMAGGGGRMSCVELYDPCDEEGKNTRRRGANNHPSGPGDNVG